MIAFAAAITSLDAYDKLALPGIRRVAEPDSEILPFPSTDSLFRNYNLILDQFKDRDDLEALVLLHQDAELVDDDFCQKLRHSLEDPEVAIVGCIGAVGVRNISWWEGAVTWASHSHRYEELGGGEFRGLAWHGDDLPAYARTGEVDSIDGVVMALSPWAVRNLRFDESLGKLHGYDFDICMQARAAGRKVVTTDFRVVHHHSLQLASDLESWIAAHIRVAEKWEGRIPEPSEDWKRRARRAEAEAAGAQLELASVRYLWEAERRELVLLREELEATKRSVSWRLTAPLRSLKQSAKRRRNGSG